MLPPADRFDANVRTFSYPRSARIDSRTPPTAPVAPTTATRVSGMRPLLGVQLELLVHGLHRALDLGGADDAGDPDRGRRDDLDVDPGVGERLEHVRGDAGVAAHAGA